MVGRGRRHRHHLRQGAPLGGSCDYLVSRDEAEGACSTRWPAGVVRMIDAVHDRHLREIERAYPV